MTGRRIIVPVSLQNKKLSKLQLNHKSIKKKMQLAHESIYWVNMNANTEETIRNCPTCLDKMPIQPKDRTNIS